MKKVISLLLALVMCLSLCACGGGNDSPATTEAPSLKEYSVGEAFGTDNVECVIEEIQWLTFEEIQANSRVDGTNFMLNTEKLFPGYQFWGKPGIGKSQVSDNSLICVKYSLQNIGKEIVTCDEESGGFLVPYGKIEVIYDDGYTFGFDDKYMGFQSTLKVLGDPVREVVVIGVPNQVLENTDKPLKLRITLPSASGETEEFIISVR